MQPTQTPAVSFPYWRLSSFYFFHFAILGVILPYWGLMLKGRGFDAQAIGELLALLMVAKMIAPNVWGWLCDATHQRILAIRVGAVLSVITFISLFWAESYWPIAIGMLIYGFFWHANLPQFEAITFTYLRDQASRYTQIRIWGSVGFILSVAFLGWLVDTHGTEVVLLAVLVLFMGLALTTFSVAEPQALPHPPSQASLGSLLRRPVVIIFFVAIFLMQTSHGPYYTFYTIYLEGFGYSKTLIGQLWALGILAEIGLFMVAHRFLDRWPVHGLLIASFLLAALRWLMIAYWPESLVGLILAQLLHAASFGLFHATAIHWVHHYFRGRLQGRGQALYSSLCFGAGGAVGSLASGYLWEGVGPHATYLLAIVLPLAAALLVSSCIRSQAFVADPHA